MNKLLIFMDDNWCDIVTPAKLHQSYEQNVGTYLWKIKNPR